MRISNQQISEYLLSQLHQLKREQLDYQNKAATGSLMDKVSDNPTSAKQVLRIESDKRNIHQFRDNLERADALLQVGADNLQQLNDVNVRIRELATLSDGVQNEDNLRIRAEEIDQMLEQAVSLANGKLYGKHLFGGNILDSLPFTVERDGDGKITNVNYSGGLDSVEYYVAEDTLMSPYLTPESSQKLTALFNTYISLRNDLEAGNQSNLEAIGAQLEEGEDQILLGVGQLGSKMTRIEFARDQENARYISLENERSSRTDADMAEMLTKLSETQVAYQASLQSTSFVLGKSLLDFI